MELILSHSSLDFDAFAAMVAASKIYPDAKIVLTGSLNRNVREFIALHKELFPIYGAKSVPDAKVRRIIIVDMRQADRLGEFEDIIHQENIEIFLFDHHPATAHDIIATEEFSGDVGAITTILVQIIKERGIRITPVEATLFALGIHEDTGSLTYQITTFADAEALAFLVSQGANIDVISKFLNNPLSELQKELLSKLLDNIEVFNIKGIKVAVSSARFDEYIEGASMLAHRLEGIMNAEAIFLIVVSDDKTYLIARSRIKQIDVSRIMQQFGGGGHSVAASAVIKDDDIMELTKKLIDIVAGSVEVPLLAKEIMTTTVHSVSSDISIQNASRMMLRSGLTGLPVVDDGKLVGIISKRDITKAHEHGLVHAPVKGFMSHKLTTASPDTDLSEIVRLICDEDIGRLPIVEDNKLIGIITRTDILRLLYETENVVGRIDSEEPVSFDRSDITQRIQSLLPGELQSLLHKIGALAEDMRFNVYLVGGIVRDILLDVPNFDIDIVVEGNGIEFARVIIDRLGGHIRAHQKFKTAVIVLPNNRTIDIASARVEHYAYPAALPKVQLSSIKNDLGRRDFTINAMAIALNAGDFGHMLDFFGGQRDLLHHKIRVLHPLSFIEDPTRIFRAVRFEQRYRFTIEEDTEDLIKKAMDMEMIGTLTNARIRDEFIHILSEDKPWLTLARLDDFGALSHVHQKITADSVLKKRFARIDAVLQNRKAYIEDDIDNWLVYMMALLEPLSHSELHEWCLRMKLRKIHEQILKQGIFETKDIFKSYLEEEGSLPDSRLYELLSQLEPESMVYLIATVANRAFRQKIGYFLQSLRGVGLSIDGNDLIGAGFQPSPSFKVILDKLMMAKLDGLVKSRQDELDFAINELSKLDKGKVRN